MKANRQYAATALKRMTGKPYFLSLIILLFFFVLLGFIGRNYYSPYNLTTKFRLWLPLMLVAIGQTFVILGGGLDLSVGALIALVNVVTVQILMTLGGTPLAGSIAILSGIAVGIAAGLVNGLLVAYLRFPPLISTYSTRIIWGGFALRVMEQSGGEVPFSWYQAYSSTILFIPFSIVLLALVLLGVLYMYRSGYITHLKACGGNIYGAYESVLPVNKIKTKSYMLCGFFTAIAAICIVSETVTGNPLAGGGYDLESISAVALGGTALAGGAGGFIGSAFGAIVLKLINDVIFFAGLGVNFQVLFQGLIIIFALAVGGMLTDRRQRTGRSKL